MRIAPIVSTPFRGSFDLGEQIKDALSKKLSGQLGNLGSDEFVPSTPSQPIMVDKIEINQGEKGIKSALKTGGVTAGGVATGYGVGDLVKHKDSSISEIFNGENDDDNENVDSESNDDDTDIEHISDDDDNDDTDVDNENDDDDFDDGDDIDDMDD